ncbi:MAG: hypothetical protein LBL23_08215 [Coriobacteriales bacterium]|jgi:uncharacterized membrane protein|nr:hypothetical protein [Coriobacteriales bacterium]
MQLISRRILLGICLFNGIAACVCGPLMFLVPDGSLMGMQSLIPAMQTWPAADIFFQDVFWPGVTLMLVNGIPNLICAILLLRRQRWQYVVGIVCGVLLILWTVWECVFMPNPVTTAYLVMGIVQTAAAVYCLAKAGTRGQKI